MIAAAPPPAAVLEAMARNNFEITHVYGLTETYGPAVICEWHDEWDELPSTSAPASIARQGVRYHMLETLMVADPLTLEPVPRRRQDAGRGFLPRQHRDDGLSQESRRPPSRRCATAGSTAATSACCIRTAISS